MDDSLLHDLITAATKAGADAADAVLAHRQSLSIGVRMNALEEVEREEARDLGLRVFVGKRQAVVSGSDISKAARTKLVERAVAMARLAPEDPYASLADPALLAKAPHRDLDLYDPTEPSPESLETLARTAEASALSTQGVTNSDGGSAAWSSTQWQFMTSAGFYGQHKSSGFSISASVIAGEGAQMERGGEGRSTRWQSDLPEASEVGFDAGRRAVARLGARKIASTTAPVIFENRLAISLFGPLIGAISGQSVARGVSFLKDKLHQKVFAAGLRISDDPFRLRGLGSSPFDDEGVAGQTLDLVSDGVLNTWLLNTASARQLGMTSTGHASRSMAGAPGVSTNNLSVHPGTRDLDGLMQDAKVGLLVTSMFGPSLNPNTGDWSIGVSGVWFEDGQAAYPVTEITVAGNLIELYARLVPGSDLEIRGAANAPSVLIDAMAIAGL
jgi:PmbA protein